MIKEYKNGNKKYTFYDDTLNNNDNIFTIIVGKNGTGKSRLLTSIIRDIHKEFYVNNFFLHKELDHEETRKGTLTYIKRPSKIIAVSTTPFDKFPLLRSSKQNHTYYKYLGLRDLRAINFGSAFMGKIIGGLIKIINEKTINYSKISKVLEYLGYTETISTIFEERINPYKDFLKNKNDSTFVEYLKDPESRYRRMYWNTFNSIDNELDNEKVDGLATACINFFEYGKSRVELEISTSGIISDFNIDDVIHLMDAGIIRLRNVSLRKLENNKIFKIDEASSGEQCVVVTLLGIACNIENNSLICIDEPEISLHPEWQERYITLLISTFSEYKNCHFIIATHSPQLISKLSTENCFILKMDNRFLESSINYVNQSIDFQLANIFNSPGFKNEYLNRIAFSIISKVGKSKKFDNDDISNFKIIESQIDNLQQNDPIIDLYIFIKELKKNYA